MNTKNRRHHPTMLISIESWQYKDGKPFKKFMKATLYGDIAAGDCIFDSHHRMQTFEKWGFVLKPGCYITCGGKSYVLIDCQTCGHSVGLFTKQILTREKDVRELINHSFRYCK